MIINDLQNIYYKLFYHTTFFRRKKYISELITIAYLCYCQKVFCILLKTFQVLKNWLTKYISLKKSHKHFSTQEKLAMFCTLQGKDFLFAQCQKNSNILAILSFMYFIKFLVPYFINMQKLLIYLLKIMLYTPKLQTICKVVNLVPIN